MKSMKTNIKADQTRFPRITRAVLRRLNRDELEDVVNHGADAGWSGFTYYHETWDFFKAHKADILAMAKEDSAAQGTGMLEMITSFNWLLYQNKPFYSQDEIAEALYSGRGENVTVIRNAMAWYALETVARELTPGALTTSKTP
jgi:hypothetical protein